MFYRGIARCGVRGARCVLENAGFRVAIVPQPNWQDSLRKSILLESEGKF
ncbi:MAG: hypothetical protein WDZ47_06260 [Bacteroidales bacterium]